MQHEHRNSHPENGSLMCSKDISTVVALRILVAVASLAGMPWINSAVRKMRVKMVYAPLRCHVRITLKRGAFSRPSGLDTPARFTPSEISATDDEGDVSVSTAA